MSITNLAKAIGGKKRKTTKKKSRKRGRFVPTKKIYKQTGTRKSLKADRKRRAHRPGKRISRTGRKYTETRRNRSDMKGKRI